MSTLTSRLGLTLPEQLDSMALGDNVLSDNYDNIDTNCHCRVVSSLGSITAPFNGQHVRNTSDNKNYIRINGSWVEFKSTHDAGSSVVGYKNSVSTNASTTVDGTEVHLLSNTVTSVTSGNRYLIIANISMVPNTATEFDWGVRLRHAAGASTTTSSTLAYTYYQDTYGISRPFQFVTTVIPGVTGQYTFSLYGIRTSGSAGNLTNNPNSSVTRLVVYDYTAI
jgi:hypothetical protein